MLYEVITQGCFVERACESDVHEEGEILAGEAVADQDPSVPEGYIRLTPEAVDSCQ